MEEKTNQVQESEKATESEKETAQKTPEQPESKPDKTAAEPEEKHFTQAEVDEIVRKRLSRATKDQAAVSAENCALKRSVSCYKAGIKAECVDDAVALADRYTDDKTDFDAALAKVLEKYPGFAGTAPAPVKNSSVDMQGKKTDQSLDALREAMGVKKPEKRQQNE